MFYPSWGLSAKQAVLSGSSLFTLNSGIFARILFLRIAFKHIFAMLQIATRV